MIQLNQLRRARELSQRDLALLAGVSPALIALVEQGKRRLGTQARNRILAALELGQNEAQRVQELAG